MKSKKVCSEQINAPYPRMCGNLAVYKVQHYEHCFYVCEEHKYLYRSYVPVKKQFNINTDFSPKQRWQIMERDGFKCVKCGRAVEDGIKLHVDHVFPKSKGGIATLKNGQTLCNECNIGKGARIEKNAHKTRISDTEEAYTPQSYL